MTSDAIPATASCAGILDSRGSQGYHGNPRSRIASRPGRVVDVDPMVSGHRTASSSGFRTCRSENCYAADRGCRPGRETGAHPRGEVRS
jgi:hypothetical protein